jgi:hypothetical protein
MSRPIESGANRSDVVDPQPGIAPPAIEAAWAKVSGWFPAFWRLDLCSILRLPQATRE